MNYKIFKFRGESYKWFEKTHIVMDEKGCTNDDFSSIEDFITCAENEDGVENLSGWIY